MGSSTTSAACMCTKSTSRAALDSAAPGPVAEGCVGAGTGMSCFDFEGRHRHLVPRGHRAWADASTVGVLALTNFGMRRRLTVDGVPAGRDIADLMPLEHREGSCIVVLATDAPLTARQCERMAKRFALGLAVTGLSASDGSGEIMPAFCMARRAPRTSAEPLPLTAVTNDHWTSPPGRRGRHGRERRQRADGRDHHRGRVGNTAYQLPLDRLVESLRRAGREAHLPRA